MGSLLHARRRFAWALALALWLPLAQALAWAHTFAHHDPQRADVAAASQLDAACAVCLGTAPLHGAPMPAPAPSMAEPPLAHESPCEHASDSPHRCGTCVYRSRAPPSALT